MDDSSKEALKTLLRGSPLLEKLSLCAFFGMHNVRSTSDNKAGMSYVLDMHGSRFLISH